MSVDIELRKAAALINTGRLDAAKSTLSNYLKEFPESDIAWLLMSYVLEDPRKQQAAATRALRMNPGNEQAKARIAQLLQSQTPTIPESTADIPVNNLENSYPQHDPISHQEEQTSSPLNIEEQLASVIHNEELSQETYSVDYPMEAFLEEPGTDRNEDNGSDPTTRVKLRPILISVSLVTLLIALGITLRNTFPGIFISEADAIKTSVAQTGTALAAANLGVKLPLNWTATITPTATKTPMPSPTPTVTNTPTPFITRTLSPTQTQIVDDPVIASEIKLLQEQVYELRELSTEENVDTHMIPSSYVRSIAEGYYFNQGGSEEEIHNTSKVLVALGLIEPGYDLLTFRLNSLIDNIGGFYLHNTNQIYIIGDQFTAVEKYAYVLEYGHALANLNFDINGMAVYPSCEGNDDRCKAIRALIEGDATFLMSQWLEEKASPADYEEIQAYQPPTWILSDQAPPQFSLMSKEFTYTKGKTFVEALFSSGGWSSVSDAYSQLPQSTEQILHPDKYLSGEEPMMVPIVDLEPILGKGWNQIKSNTLGEWLTYLILRFGTDPIAQVSEYDALRASEGWGGDHYQVYYNDLTDETLLVAHWKWDHPGDTNEFTNGMRNYLRNRFPGEGELESDRECWYGDNQFTCLYDDYQQSLWIVAPSMGLLDLVQALYPDF